MSFYPFWFRTQLCLFLIFPFDDLVSRNEFTSLEHYRSGVSLLNSGETLRAIDAFEAAIAKNGRFANAHHQLALAYIKVGTIESRRKATLAMNKALRLDSKNVRYHLDMAKLFLRKGIRGGAEGSLKTVLDLDAANAEAYYQLGLLKEEDMLWYKDMINPQRDGIYFTFTSYANEDLRAARGYFKKAIEADNRFAPAYYHLALTLHELSDYYGMADYLRRAVEIQPKNKDFYLFLGLAHHRIGDSRSANQNFQNARNFMSDEELALYESLEAVLKPESCREYVSMGASEKSNFERSYWKQRDPLFMTEFNERLLEHFARFAYANLRFGKPEKGIEGWQTDRGKTYIRFGPPDTQKRTRPNTEMTVGSGRYPLVASKEKWAYEDFQLTFEDEFLNRNFKFQRTLDPETDSKIIFEELLETVPEFYEPDFDTDIFEIPHRVSQFMGSQGQTKVVLSFAVPRDAVKTKYANVFLRMGLFIFDKDWNDVSRNIDNRRLSLNNEVYYDDTALLLDKLEFQLAPESYHIALELMDDNSGSIGTLRQELTARYFDPHNLEISDLLLAHDIQADSSLTKTIENVKIWPSFFSEFEVQESIFVYFEVYNLALSAGNASHYRIETVLGPRVGKKGSFSKLVSNLGSLFGLGKSKEATVSTVHEYYGNSKSESVYNSLRMADTKPNEYNLVVKVEDLSSGQKVESNVTFEIKKRKN